MLRHLFFFLALGIFFGPVYGSDDTGSLYGAAVVLDVEGPIGPATSDYVSRSFARAREESAALMILRMDTPGGLDTAMREIIQDILASPIPVVTFVSPGGARAASAGTYILLASHIAAMAPGTNVGAATPVQLAGPGIPGEQSDPDAPNDEGVAGQGEPAQSDPAGPESSPLTDPMAHKMQNDAVAYIRGLADIHGRNAEWAEKAVREAASLPAADALAQNVIDVIAQDLPELLKAIDGREVMVQGKSVLLSTSALPVVTLLPDWRTRLLAVITNPNVAYILMLIGVYGLILEFYNPGGFVPGIVGAICLLLALFAFQALPISYAGAGLILLGILLMVAEAVVPSFGALGIGGAVAFIIGSVMLIQTDVPGFGISPALIGAVGLVTAILFVLLIGVLARSRHRPLASGDESLLDERCEVIEDFQGQGQVRIHSEIWSARCASPVRRGQRVRVIGREGLVLLIEPLQSPSAGSSK
ncbi:MAG: nodulation protein NfeD [Pseudomonadota bacterium]|nr:nodulation protein NfeD [Pseudomonadota bacterium]